MNSFVTVLHQRFLTFPREFNYRRDVRKSKTDPGNLIFEYHAPRVSQDGKQKVVLLIPGVTGDIYEPYIKATMEHASLKGYHCVMLNATAPSLSNEKELAIINFKEHHVIE